MEKDPRSSITLIGVGVGIGAITILLLLWIGAPITGINIGGVEVGVPTQRIPVQQNPTQPPAQVVVVTATPYPTLPVTIPVISSPSSSTSQGKYPCPLVVRQSEVNKWKVGQTSVPAVQEAINQFDARRPYNEGAFVKETTIPSGVVVATNFDERDANAWTRYPVIPLIHSGSWGLFQTTGEFVAPTAGACMTVVP